MVLCCFWAAKTCPKTDSRLLIILRFLKGSINPQHDYSVFILDLPLVVSVTNSTIIYYLVVEPTHLKKYARQFGSFPQGMVEN